LAPSPPRVQPYHRALAGGSESRIIIRGDNVTAGYENNPGANAEAFHDGWFRTGDVGQKVRESAKTRSKEMARRAELARRRV
jgi:acyl-CoA synthetase (AMP-forming)/AMP-acid ligase II